MGEEIIMKLKMKFALLILVVIISIGALNFLTLNSLNNISNITSEHQNKNTPVMITSLSLQKDVIQIQQWLTDISATRGKSGLDDGFDLAANYYESSKDKIKDLKELGVDPEVIDPISQNLDEFYQMGIEMANAYIDKGTDEGNKYMEEFDPYAVRIEESIGVLLEEADNNFDNGNSTISLKINYLYKNSIVLLCFIIAVCILLFIIVNQLIIKPIIKMTGISEKIANLDVTENIPEKLLNKKDEIGILSGALQNITKNIRDIIGEISLSSEQVSYSAELLCASAQQSAASIEEVSMATEEIASNALQQAQSTENGHKKAILLGEIIEKDQGHLANLNKVTLNVLQAVDEGLKEIEKLSNISKQSIVATDEVQEGIIKTNTSADKIEKASSIIASIAQQTNLLALNATIEAARAGEAGKGFVVVANEIRNLAQKSTASTKAIDEVINELQSNSKAAVEIMEKVAIILKDQADSVELSKEKYITISDMIKEAAYAGEKLNESSGEIANMKVEMMSILENLSSIAEENSSTTQQVSASMEEQRASMEEISSSNEGLAQLSKDLQSIIFKFKI